LNREAIITDLSTERPQWILSAYSAAPKAPIQLFGGPQRERSFEEMRLHHYNALATGNPAAAVGLYPQKPHNFADEFKDSGDRCFSSNCRTTDAECTQQY
jgi:hypothetical protein